MKFPKLFRFFCLAASRLEPDALVIASLGLEIPRPTVLATAAARRMTSVSPRTGQDRQVVFHAQAFVRWRNFETKGATGFTVARPPACPQNGLAVFFAQTLLFGWYRGGSITLRATSVAVAGLPITRPYRFAVNLAKSLSI